VRSELSISHSSWVRSFGVGTVLACALWNLNKLRLGYTKQGRRFLEDERRVERKRIARELHDTLLQGLQGILLEFEVLSSRLPEEERERAAKIERKLRHIVMDGRNAINALRLPDDEKDWMAAVLEMGERAVLDSKVNFTLKIKGEPWSLPLKARVEVLAIVREGLRNALEHSHAKTILVVVRYCEKRAEDFDSRQRHRRQRTTPSIAPERRALGNRRHARARRETEGKAGDREPAFQGNHGQPRHAKERCLYEASRPMYVRKRASMEQETAPWKVLTVPFAVKKQTLNSGDTSRSSNRSNGSCRRTSNRSTSFSATCPSV
jgi:hypothetical protein